MTFFYGPLYLAVTCLALGLPEEYFMWIFRETSGFISVFCSLLGSTVFTYFCQFTEALVFGSCDRFSSCSLCPRIQCSAWFDSGYMLGVSLRGLLASTLHDCGFSAVAVHRRSSTSSCSAEADPHGPVCSADHRDSSDAVRFQVVDAPVVQVVWFHRLFISVYSAPLGSTADTSFESVYGVFHFLLRELEDYGS